MNPLSLSTRHTAAGPVVEVVGDLDFIHAPALSRCVETTALKPGQCLIVDLAGLEFCDSSGITALIAVHRYASVRGVDMALAAVPANTMRVLRVVGLDQVFTFRPGAGDASNT
ncbi:STAS domain-containing protein [Streptomyces sp. NPDC020731]|uniref:STAS domain-containing protein n=1 Tax=Streptomyces sp. NPDC020731 TaxID=3365085 RepID=UPI00378ADA9D